MSTELSNLAIENSNTTSTVKVMDADQCILYVIFITVAIGCLLVDQKRFFILWNKCKSSIVELIYYKHLRQNRSSRISLVGLRRWEYRGEGNEYLAISLLEQKKILRLRKSVYPNGFVENLKDWYLQNLTIEEAKATKFEKLNLKYYQILVSLIGEIYVQPSEDILLFRDEIFKINNIIASKRPDYRKKKKIAYSCGSLLMDYAYLPSDWEISQFDGPTFAVEIKPKQGWIPQPERTYQLCTYCLNQYIKLQNGETSGISEYCPMDLFSGQISRMKFAIISLLNTPQNNIKIFQEGELVFGEGLELKYEPILCNIFNMTTKISVNEFCDLVTTALLKQLHIPKIHQCSSYSNDIKNKLNKNYASFTNKVCNLNHFKLPEGCVLNRILNLQELDTWGSNKVIGYLNQQYFAYRENIYGHAAKVIARAKTKKHNLSCAKCFFYEKTGQSADLIIQKYLMSAVAKDCSLMLTFRKLKTRENITIPKQHIIKTAFGVYAFNIGVFDLYPKPLTCIFKHLRKRSKFIQIYKHITNGNDNFI